MYIVTYKSCINGKVTITEANSFDLPYMQEELPDATFTVYQDTNVCLGAAFKDEVEGYMGHSNKICHAVNGYAKYRTARIGGINESNALCFCVEKSNTPLYSIWNKLNACYSNAQIADLVTQATITKRRAARPHERGRMRRVRDEAALLLQALPRAKAQPQVGFLTPQKGARPRTLDR